MLYVETPYESAGKIPLNKQRHLINHLQLATELGAEIIKVKADKVSSAIVEQAEQRKITTLCIGKPHLNIWQTIGVTNIFNNLLKKLSDSDIDVVVLS